MSSPPAATRRSSTTPARLGASGTGYVIPAGTDEAIVNEAPAVGASGTGYVIPAGSDQAIVNDAIVNDGTSAAAAPAGDATLSSTDAAAIGTGAILLLAGGAFAATRTRRRPDMSDVAPA